MEKKDRSEYLNSNLQGTVVKNFACRVDNFTSWNPRKANTYVTKEGLKIQKVPYEDLVLVQDIDELSPTRHYSELVTFLLAKPPSGTIFIHSADSFAVLLIAAASSENASIVVSKDFPNQYALLTTFIFNNIKKKISFADNSAAENAGIVVTKDEVFAQKYVKTKSLLYLS